MKIINDDLTKPWNKKYCETSLPNETNRNRTASGMTPELETIRHDHKELKSLIKKDSKKASN